MTDRTWLEPLLVDYAGRDGSTLFMRLLGTSPQIAIGSEYPYEEKYFTFLWFWSRLLERDDFPPDVWNHENLGSLFLEPGARLMGPPPWRNLELFDMDESGSVSSRVFELVWEEFCVTAAAHRGSAADVRLYAEKHLMTWRVDSRRLPPVKVMALLRDPRDVWVSVSTVNQRRNQSAQPLIGRAPGETDAEWLNRFIEDQRARARWILSLRGTGIPVFRYEDLVRDLPGQAEILERWLEVSVDAEAVLADEAARLRHATSPSAEASIGRWRHELPSGEAAQINQDLRHELAALGY
jgi:hypothetical protein